MKLLLAAAIVLASCDRPHSAAPPQPSRPTTSVQAAVFIEGQVIRITDDAVCAGCVIRKPVMVIHDRKLPGALAGLAWAHATRDGRFFVTSGTRGSELYLTDPTGAIVRQIGRVGDGPGEYRGPGTVIETDSGFVVLETEARATYLNHALQLVRSVRLPGPVLAPAAPLPGNLFAMSWNHVMERGEPVSEPVHVIGGDGARVRSFGGPVRQPPDPQVQPLSVSRVVASSASGDLWVAHRHSYRIERWDPDGKLISVYERDLPWLGKPHEGGRPGSAPAITRIVEDGEGRLWVEIRTYRAPLPTPGSRADHSLSELYVEVLDLREAKVVANGTFVGWIPAATTGSLYVTTYGQAADGEPELQVWTFAVLRK